MKRIGALLLILALVGLPAVAGAASHTVTPQVIAQSGTAITFKLDWSSLAAAGADTGTAVIDPKTYPTLFEKLTGVNTSGTGVITMVLSATFATNIDSCRSEVSFGTATGGSYVVAQTYSGSAGTLNGTLLTATVPFKTLTISPVLAGPIRIRTSNKDASTAGLIDQYITFIKHKP